MENSNSASDEIKSIALDDKFTEIENKFGKKKCGKADNYLEVEQGSVKVKQHAMMPLDVISYAVRLPAVVVTPVRTPSAVSKPAIVKSFRPPATQKTVAPTTDASDGEGTSAKETSKEMQKAKTKVAKTDKAGKTGKAKAEKPVKPEMSVEAAKNVNLPQSAECSHKQNMCLSVDTRDATLSDSTGMGCMGEARETGAHGKVLAEEEKQPYVDLTATSKQQHEGTRVAGCREGNMQVFDASSKSEAKLKGLPSSNNTAAAASATQVKQKHVVDNSDSLKCSEGSYVQQVAPLSTHAVMGKVMGAPSEPEKKSALIKDLGGIDISSLGCSNTLLKLLPSDKSSMPRASGAVLGGGKHLTTLGGRFHFPGASLLHNKFPAAVAHMQRFKEVQHVCRDSPVSEPEDSETASAPLKPGIPCSNHKVTKDAGAASESVRKLLESRHGLPREIVSSQLPTPVPAPLPTTLPTHLVHASDTSHDSVSTTDHAEPLHHAGPGKQSAATVEMTVKVLDHTGLEVSHETTRDAQLEGAMQKYVDKKGIRLDDCTFRVDGDSARPHDTPEVLGMEDGDVICALLPQVGGGDRYESAGTEAGAEVGVGGSTEAVTAAVSAVAVPVPVPVAGPPPSAILAAAAVKFEDSRSWTALITKLSSSPHPVVATAVLWEARELLRTAQPWLPPLCLILLRLVIPLLINPSTVEDVWDFLKDASRTASFPLARAAACLICECLSSTNPPTQKGGLLLFTGLNNHRVQPNLFQEGLPAILAALTQLAAIPAWAESNELHTAFLSFVRKTERSFADPAVADAMDMVIEAYWLPSNPEVKVEAVKLLNKVECFHLEHHGLFLMAIPVVLDVIRTGPADLQQPAKTTLIKLTLGLEDPAAAAAFAPEIQEVLQDRETEEEAQQALEELGELVKQVQESAARATLALAPLRATLLPLLIHGAHLDAADLQIILMAALTTQGVTVTAEVAKVVTTVSTVAQFLLSSSKHSIKDWLGALTPYVTLIPGMNEQTVQAVIADLHGRVQTFSEQIPQDLNDTALVEEVDARAVAVLELRKRSDLPVAQSDQLPDLLGDAAGVGCTKAVDRVLNSGISIPQPVLDSALQRAEIAAQGQIVEMLMAKGAHSKKMAPVALGQLQDVNGAGAVALEGSGELLPLLAHLDSPIATVANAALLEVQSLRKGCGAWIEFHIPLILHPMLKSLVRADTAASARGAFDTFIAKASAAGQSCLVSLLLEALDGEGECWQTRKAALILLTDLIQQHPFDPHTLVEIISTVCVLASALGDHIEVTEQAHTAAVRIASTTRNPDLAPVMGKIIAANIDPQSIDSALDALMGTPFRHKVSLPELSLVLPLLERYLGQENCTRAADAVKVFCNVCLQIRDSGAVPMVLDTLKRMYRKHSGEGTDLIGRALVYMAHLNLLPKQIVSQRWKATTNFRFCTGASFSLSDALIWLELVLKTHGLALSEKGAAAVVVLRQIQFLVLANAQCIWLWADLALPGLLQIVPGLTKELGHSVLDEVRWKVVDFFSKLPVDIIGTSDHEALDNRGAQLVRRRCFFGLPALDDEEEEKIMITAAANAYYNTLEAIEQVVPDLRPTTLHRAIKAAQDCSHINIVALLTALEEKLAAKQGISQDERLSRSIEVGVAVICEKSSDWAEIVRGLKSEDAAKIIPALQAATKFVQNSRFWAQPHRCNLLLASLPHHANPATEHAALVLVNAICDKANAQLVHFITLVVCEGMLSPDLITQTGALLVLPVLLPHHHTVNHVQERLNIIVNGLFSLATDSTAAAARPALRKAFDALISTVPGDSVQSALSLVRDSCMGPPDQDKLFLTVQALSDLGAVLRADLPRAALLVIIPLLLTATKGGNGKARSIAEGVLSQLIGQIQHPTDAAAFLAEIKIALRNRTDAQAGLASLASLAAQATAQTHRLTVFLHTRFGAPFGPDDAYKVVARTLLAELGISADSYSAEAKVLAGWVFFFTHTKAVGSWGWVPVLCPGLQLILDRAKVTTTKTIKDLVKAVLKRITILTVSTPPALNDSLTTSTAAIDGRLVEMLSARAHADLADALPEHIEYLLPKAAREGYLRTAQYITAGKLEVPAAVKDKALVEAVCVGQEQVVELLLRKDASANQLTPDGRTLLEVSAANGNRMLMRHLVTSLLRGPGDHLNISEEFRAAHASKADNLDKMISTCRLAVDVAKLSAKSVKPAPVRAQKPTAVTAKQVTTTEGPQQSAAVDASASVVTVEIGTHMEEIGTQVSKDGAGGDSAAGDVEAATEAGGQGPRAGAVNTSIAAAATTTAARSQSAPIKRRAVRALRPGQEGSAAALVAAGKRSTDRPKAAGTTPIGKKPKRAIAADSTALVGPSIHQVAQIQPVVAAAGPGPSVSTSADG